MNRFCLLLSVAVWGGLLGGCDPTVQPVAPSPPADTPAVYIVLRSGVATQHALLARPWSVNRNADSLQYISGATVQVGGRTFTEVRGDERVPTGRNLWGPRANSNYVVRNWSINGGATYDLQVTWNGKTVTGTTRVPEDFSIMVDSLTVRWDESDGAAQYILKVQRFADDGESRYYTYQTRTPETRVRLDTAEITLGARFRPGPHEITVIAVDSNLARYHTGSAVRRSGLDDGIGFFGAETVVQDTVVLPAAG